MLVVHGPQQTMAGNRRAIAFVGGVPLHSWWGPSALGKVKEAADWAAAFPGEKPREYVIPTDDPTDPVFSAMVALADNPATPAEATVKLTDAQLAKIGAGVSAPVDYAAIAKAVNDDAAARLAKV